MKRGSAESAPSSRTFRRMTAKARGSDSTRTAREAPRDRASKASAPVPANRSSTRAPPVLSPRISNIASLTRSAVGLTARPPGVRIRLPRHTPATMRTAGLRERGKPDLSGVRKNREHEDFRRHPLHPVPSTKMCLPIIGISLSLVKESPPHARIPPPSFPLGQRGTLSAGKSGKGSQ